MATRTVSVALVADVGQYQSAMVRAASATKGVGTAAATTGADTKRGFDLASKGALVLGAGAGAAALGLKSAIGAASDLSETLNKSNVIFGDNAGEVEAWAENSARNFGLSKAAALDAAAGFGNMLQQLGYTGDEAMNASTDVVQLAADLGSFNNLETGDVLDRIGAAMRGEYDSLQLLIPNINAARVETEALTMTGKENKDALTAQEKAAAVLAIVNRDGAAAANDFAETSGGLANATKIAKAEFENLQAEIGERFLPIAANAMGFISSSVLPALGGFADIVFDLVEAFTNLPGPVQIAAGAAGLWAIAGGQIMDVLRPMGGAMGGMRDTWRSFGDALDYARANGDGMVTVLKSTADYTGGRLLTGLGNLARAIGPELGIAAAVAGIGFMVEGLTSMDEATDEAKAAQQDLADALRETNGVIDENVRQSAAKAAQDAGLLDTAETLGVSLSTVTDAVLGNAAAYDEVIAASEDYLNQQLILVGGDPTDAKFANSADAVRIFQNNLGELAPTVKNTIGDQQQLAAATEETGTTAVETVDPIAAYKAELEAAAAAADEAKKQTDQFKLSLDILSGATVSMIEVESAFQAAIDEATGAMEGLDGSVMNAEGSLNLNSEAGRRASDVLLDVRNRGNDLIATMIQQKASTDEVTAADRTLRESFIESARQMGISEEAALELADQILGIPSERETTITADTAQAAGAISGLQTQIDNVAKDRTASINFRATLPDLNGSASGSGRPGLATGGYVQGPGTDTSDSIPVNLSNGEYVIRAARVRELGVGTLNEINQGRRGFANGGLVSLEAMANTDSAVAGLNKYSSDLTSAIDKASAALAAAANVPGSGGSLVGGGTMVTRLFNTIRAAFPRAKLNSGYRQGDPGYHGSARAVDLGEAGFAGGSGRPYLGQMAAWIYRNHGAATKELIYTGAYDSTPDLKNGRPLNYGGATNAAHRNHVHWAMFNGGVIGEPVVGVGMRSGASYSFAERGPEVVLPTSSREFGGLAAGPAGVATAAPNVIVEARVFVGNREITDIVRVEANAVVAQRDAGRGINARSWRP